MNGIGFRPLSADISVYRRGSVWILLYVDEIILIGSVWEDLDDTKPMISVKLEIKDLRELKSFLRMVFSRDKQGARLSQSHNVIDILEIFRMGNCKPVSTPACTSGSVSCEKGGAVDQRTY